MRLPALLCAAALALAGCGASEPTATAGTAIPPAATAAAPSSASTAAPATQEVPAMTSYAQQAIAMHAQAFNVDPATVTLISAEEVEWTSSALGCAKPDMMYMTVMTPGFRVVVEQGGQQYAYHAGRDGAFFLCESPQK
jgi:glucose/arabinose dehydrogenase